MKKSFDKKKVKNNTLIIEKNKVKENNNSKNLQDKLLELEDFEIEALFENGRITQDEYEYILNFRLKKKEKKKNQKKQFEERIRCDNNIIQKVINLGRRFRVEDLLAHGKFEEAKKIDVNREFFNEEQEYEIGARTRDKQKEERVKQKYIDRNFRGRERGRERDSR